MPRTALCLTALAVVLVATTVCSLGAMAATQAYVGYVGRFSPIGPTNLLDIYTGVAGSFTKSLGQTQMGYYATGKNGNNFNNNSANEFVPASTQAGAIHCVLVVNEGMHEGSVDEEGTRIQKFTQCT